MRFSYRVDEVEPTPFDPSTEVRRPLLQVRVIGLSDALPLRGLVDTGSADCVPFQRGEGQTPRDPPSRGRGMFARRASHREPRGRRAPTGPGGVRGNLETAAGHAETPARPGRRGGHHVVAPPTAGRVSFPDRRGRDSWTNHPAKVHELGFVTVAGLAPTRDAMYAWQSGSTSKQISRDGGRDVSHMNLGWPARITRRSAGFTPARSTSHAPLGSRSPARGRSGRPVRRALALAREDATR